jgi:ferredoxin
MKIKIDPEQCQGHALCIAWAANIIQLHDENGHAYVLSETVLPEDEEAARNAASACPERAIVLVDV